ncbi:HAMP domain-containing sensor histidine kinase [Dysgonomonas sp. 25]|uniref:sensor histidine kinase n=1 Tax=Dysgonomonas sp. 25 TaxID=2302933 RepID=UPI0013CF73CD|nr:HAMP domain-containing sensor histidine kinase [Dysgonomonas sp. 25]NDV67304.1 sensor histidine kinase [Dysgonomonas sp. 25]
MKKSVIWVLASVMVFAFCGLLYMQMKYIRTSLRLRSDQFNEAVTRSLYQVKRNLELEQTKRYLNESYIASQKKKGYNDNDFADDEEEVTISHSFKVVVPDGSAELSMDVTGTTQRRTNPIFQSPNKRNNANAISKSFFDLQEEQKKRFVQEQKNLNEVISEIMRTASNVPITERINFRTLEDIIRGELKTNGIEIPFQYEIVDRNERVIYKQQGFDEGQRDNIYPQVLFSNDGPGKNSYYLKVFFPTKQDYLFREISFLIPSILFTFILLVTFIITIFIILRQKKLSEMKSDFMNNMTHELKTPVSTISLAAQMLKDPSITKSPEVFKHISGVINDETERLSFQVEKVLQMSLFEKQKATLKQKELDANDIIVNVANTSQLKVEKFGGHLDIDLEATESTIMADKMHFTNVLFNLVDNAIKYRREDVDLELLIRSWNSGNRLYISVEDNGVGIRKEYVKRVFDRFYRVSTGNVHDVKGFGLGLAYVKKIVEDHKGTIKAESELGKGTKFIMSLPLINMSKK